MSSLLNPYLTFPGTARDAMEFYRSIFGGELTVSTFGEFGAPDEALADKVMHAMLTTPQGYTLMASDTAPGMEFKQGNTMSVSLSGDDDALRDYFEKLADGGAVVMKLEKQMWGDEFGQCVDKFGVPWLVNIGQGQG
jgi:PhnB protein